jgi:hypothetical protein
MWWRVLVASILLFVAGFGAHEVMHLLVIYAVGSQGEIIARPWHLYFLDFSIWSVHAQPAEQLDVVRQSLVNFLGPFLAAIPFAVLLLWVREPIALAALIANVVILVFYAVIELLYVLGEAVWHTDMPLLVTPEFNYGVPLAIILLAVLATTLLSLWGGRRIPE